MLLHHKVMAGLFGLLVFASALAQGPDDLLTVTGSITTYTDRATKSYVFSERELLALPQHTIKTATSWTPQSVFTGPRLSDVLAKVGAKGVQVELHCLDDYSYTVSIAEASRYGVILAHTMNGNRLQVSDFGPLFSIYPRDQYPKALQTPVSEAKFAWQIRELVVK